MIQKEDISAWFQGLQDQICNEIEQADGTSKFKEELWKHEHKGGGRTRILQKGSILEKAGVNFSGVESYLSDNILNALKLSNNQFFATGVSIVMHPVSPMVPIIHMNVRYFETPEEYWFGGGIDLTPHYIVEEDAQFFHRALKDTCDRFDPQYYPRFKTWADEYFFNKHRNETRGIGGIFFDRLNEDREKKSKEEIWEFVKAVGSLFPVIYTQLMKKNALLPYTEEHKQFQSLRRGRYVEFNLVYDKGTKFGFETSGRTESILMSMPPIAAWEYQHSPLPGSVEEKTLLMLKKGINWV